MRVQYKLFVSLPDNIESRFAVSNPERLVTSLHRNYWQLSTKDVNEFRIAEVNRWLAAFESISAAAQPKPGTTNTIPLVEQEVNSLMVTAMIRLMRLSLGCLNPAEFPAIWLGKRWVKSRFSNDFQQNTLSNAPAWRKRQGLGIGEMVYKHNMMWIPEELGIWDLQLPVLQVRRFPNLDVNVNTIRSTLGVSMAASRATTLDGKIREFTRTMLRNLINNREQNHQEMLRAYTILSQMCVQSYILGVWEDVFLRWSQQTGQQKASMAEFDEVTGRSSLAKRGLEILSFDRLDHYLGNYGADVMNVFDIAYAKTKNTSTRYPSWGDNTWRGRVMPLFRPANVQPNWARKTLYVKKLEEVIALLNDACAFAGREPGSFTSAFFHVLSDVVPRYMQAILHYDYDKGITVAKASKHNSIDKQEERKNLGPLTRTKWMFPRFADYDMESYHIKNGVPRASSSSSINWIAISSRWVILTEQDKKTATKKSFDNNNYLPKCLVYRGSTLEGPEDLEELIEYLREVDDWVKIEHTVALGGEVDESGWPPHPDEQN
ncbi:hypothetical protein HBI81_256560 [Parastagonospora nodorum]|nr:hypothetical protein HBI18_241300 [Parastagonospora nodorum]KAH6510781.1 hypothetical protein HBI81_256560 [Parastagonospora nodorum]